MFPTARVGSNVQGIAGGSRPLSWDQPTGKGKRSWNENEEVVSVAETPPLGSGDALVVILSEVKNLIPGAWLSGVGSFASLRMTGGLGLVTA